MGTENAWRLDRPDSGLTHGAWCEAIKDAAEAWLGELSARALWETYQRHTCDAFERTQQGIDFFPGKAVANMSRYDAAALLREARAAA